MKKYDSQDTERLPRTSQFEYGLPRTSQFEYVGTVNYNQDMEVVERGWN